MGYPGINADTGWNQGLEGLPLSRLTSKARVDLHLLCRPSPDLASIACLACFTTSAELKEEQAYGVRACLTMGWRC